MQISSSPYLRAGLYVPRLMLFTIIALLPAIGGAIYFYGYSALSVISVSVITALLTEYLVKKLRGRPFIMDGSAPLIGLLIALTLPPRMELWIVVCGTIFAIAIVKEAFGGLGHYIFSPVMGARVFLEVSFISQFSNWVKPMGFTDNIVIADTPLAQTFIWSGTKFALYNDMFFGNLPGSIGEVSALLILIGGILLLTFRLINWRVPLAFIGTVALFTWLLGEDPLFHILAGGLLLAAFFISTDPTTSPITHRGRILFAIGCGVFTVIIRQFAVAQEGVYYAVLLMNSVVPLIDRFIRPKPRGVQRAVKNADV
ncbi:RnfABCDGE type electron transport complex subunit D [Chloroflexota bacterium]